MRSLFVRESFYSVPAHALFSFHERPDAFRLLVPPEQKIQIVSTASTLQPSEERVKFVVPFSFLKFAFEMKHTEYEKGNLFVDEQVKGLFSHWRHEHHFIQGGWRGEPASMLSDRISIGHPLLFMFRPFVVHRLKKIFEFRHRVTAASMGELARKGRASGKTIVVTGATGLIGSRVVELLTEQGARVVVFVRNMDRARKMFGQRVEYAFWDFNKPSETAWKAFIPEADAVLHLAGTPLFSKRWRKKFKKAMEQSRVLGTRQIADAIRESDPRPQTLVSASAIGYYGTERALLAREDSRPAEDILARICIGWEAEAKKLASVGVRDVQIRTGIVLSRKAGALKSMLPLFRMGMGGWMGHPDAWINWIHLEDIARIFTMALLNENMQGPYNAVAPGPVIMRQFAKTLSRALHRPGFMAYPAALLRPMLGEAANYVAGGARVSAERVSKVGYSFFFDDLQSALQNTLRSGR